MDAYHMPHHLDAPFRMFLLTIDELCVLAIPAVFGVFILNVPFIGIALGVGLLISLKRLKGDQGHYFLHHLIYWYLPQIVPLKVTPPSYMREFVG